MSVAEQKCNCKDEKKPYVSAARWLRESKVVSGEYDEINTALIKDEVKIKIILSGVTDENKDSAKTIKVKLFYEQDVTDKLDETKSISTQEIKITQEDGIYQGESDAFDIEEDWNLSTLKIIVLGSDNSGLCKNRFDGPDLEVRMEYAELRISVIDCRSGEPVKNAKVKKLKIKVGDKEIVEDFQMVPFLTPPTPYYTNKKEDIAKNSMAVLKALNLFTKDTSYNRIPASYKNETNFAWITKFNEYWKERVTAPELKEKEDSKFRLLMKLMCRHYDSHSATDKDGILTIYIPKLLLDGNEATVEVGFYDFPVALERVKGGSTSAVLRKNQSVGHLAIWRDIRRSKSVINSERGTEFKIVWNTAKENQDYTDNELAWGTSLGWEIHHGEEKSELKVSEKITIKNDKDKFEDFKMNILSPFYDSIDFYDPHFVLFAMVWCQPVWDGVEDNGKKSYVSNPMFSQLNMHIATMFSGESGKGYGKADYIPRGGVGRWRTKTGHAGIDLHARVNDKVFAIHGGSVKYIDAKPELKRGTEDTTGKHKGWEIGNNQTIYWEPDYKKYMIGYCHLDSFVQEKPKYVMAGQITGYAGRTGNLERPSDAGIGSPYPTHVHLNLGGNNLLRTTIERLSPINAMIIPNNDYPLMLPCACEVTKDSPEGCNCQSAHANSCWAVLELRCPHLKSNRERRIQAQLHSLGLYSGGIDGKWGLKPLNQDTKKSNTRNGIFAFKKKNYEKDNPNFGVTFNANDYDIDSQDEMALNQSAPLQIQS